MAVVCDQRQADQVIQSIEGFGLIKQSASIESGFSSVSLNEIHIVISDIHINFTIILAH